TRDRLYLDAMQQIMTNTTKIVIEKGGNNLLYLPLDKIMQMGGTSEAAPAAATSAPHAAAPDPSTARSREAFRSRDREQRP
ncbi:MAG TPA: protease modulator HflK, partial [Burkholderiales bacterium]|nr:protease modulator HflK [Burkholderiales bacterium]